MIDRDALEAKARELEQALGEAADSVRSTGTKNALGVAAALLVAFLVGRRRGRSKGARIEIHRL